MKPHVILGLVGQPLSGKDTVAAHLVDTHKFVHVSTGDLLRFYMAENNLGQPTRDLMQKVGNILRAEHGADYLMRLALKTEANSLVVSGIRAIAEATALKAAGGLLVACSAPLAVRYERATGRGRAGDKVNLETFKQQEAAESSSNDPNAQSVSAVVAMADFTVENSGDLEHLYKQVDELLTGLINKNQ